MCVLQNSIKPADSQYVCVEITDTGISIKKITSKDKYKMKNFNDTKLKYEKLNPAAHILNIIDIYARNSKRAKNILMRCYRCTQTSINFTKIQIRY